MINKLYLNAGQMKAGTTFLYTLLKQHPEVFFSYEKEIHYLSQKLGPIRILNDAVRLRKAKSIVDVATRLDRPYQRYQHILRWAANYLDPPTHDAWYEAIFDGRRPEQWAADFSNLTCIIPEAGLRRITEMADEVRVTYCLRNPMDRALSHAKFHLKFAGANHNLVEMDRDELSALLESDNIWPQSQSHEHVENLVAAFGEDRVRIIKAEDLWQDPASVASGVCKFLGIAPLDQPLSTEPINVGPSSEVDADILALFQEKFAPLQERIDRTLDRYAHLVIA